MARKGPTAAIYKFSFVSEQSIIATVNFLEVSWIFYHKALSSPLAELPVHIPVLL